MPIGLGNYVLMPQFVNAARSVEEILLIPSYSPNEIIDKVFLKNTVDISQKTEIYDGWENIV
jgi:hypothetical protein